VSVLLERQRHHPLLEGFPTAARVGNMPLFLGEAGAAQVRVSSSDTSDTIHQPPTICCRTGRGVHGGP